MSTNAACGTEDLLLRRSPAASADVVGGQDLVTDGSVPHDGAEWDAPAALVLRSNQAFLSYDLGEPRALSAIYVQADANDTYQVSGSLDGSEGSYHLLATVPNVVESQGHGLRGRALGLSERPVVRFLRLGEAAGDGAYSVAEFAAYCQTPQPFPPKLDSADTAPSAAAPAPPTPRSGQEDSGPLHTLLLTLGVALSVAGALALRSKRSQPGSAAAAPRTERSSLDGLLHVLFLLSGCAALIYEVVWLHLLRLVIGASALSVGIVLASFMGGMFLGSLLFSRWVPKDENPLRVYAYLELGIGGFGLLMPLVLPAVRSLYFGLVGYGPLGIGLRAFIAAVTLLPPTALMGATLPAVSRRYSHGRQGMARLASLYSANTLGAVLGCLLSAFYLLAYFDVWVATLAAVLLNAAVFALALRKSRALDQVSETALLESAESLPRASVEPYAIYLAAALSGLTALGAQVVWTRLLTLLFGATVYAFAIILAVFLGSLGLGSALSAWLLRRGLEPARGLAFSQAALIPTLLLAAHLLANVLPYASPTGAPPIAALHALHVLRALDVILPAGVFWGMSFPFALAAAGLGRGDPARSSGRVYAANTIGAIVGALATSFVMIPRLGTQRAQQALVLIAAISAAAMFRSLMREPRSEGSFARLLGALAAWSLALGAFAAATLPGLSKVFLAHGRYLGASDPRDQYLYVSEGAASTVAVHVAPDGTRHFHVSGRVEASNNPADLRLERLLGHLSALAHEEPRTVLVVGLGAGITAGALGLHPIKRLVICEIEPRVTGAAAQFAHENYDILHDPRVELVFDDARHYLATTRERFDIITSDPIHPWVRGNSVLFSEEYYEIVRSRLNPGGIATQWVPLYETSEAAIQIQMKTFSNAFPNGTVWNSAVTGRGYDVVLLGSAAPLHLNLARIQSRIDRDARIARSLREAKIGSVVDLLGTYATSARDMSGWLAGASVNRDFSLKLEYISGLALNETQADPINAHMIAGRHYPEGIFEAAPALQEDLKRRIP